MMRERERERERESVCVLCVRNDLKYALRWHIHIYQFIPYYASAIHAHTHPHTI